MDAIEKENPSLKENVVRDYCKHKICDFPDIWGVMTIHTTWVRSNLYNRGEVVRMLEDLPQVMAKGVCRTGYFLDGGYFLGGFLQKT